MTASQRVKDLGRDAGFHLVGITSADKLTVEGARYLEWISEGRHGDMGWITPDRAERSADPRSVLPEARSVICVALAYRAPGSHSVGPIMGRVARYAWGRDYHTVLGERLQTFVAALRDEFGGEHRWYVDTGPLMERALAARAGVGWYGKNTNVLTERLGSWVVLGEIVSTLELEADEPLQRTCGSCRLCMVACPTGALGPAYTIDGRTCISYLTIEHRGPIPRQLRSSMGNWVFGCDICQEVCPPSMEPYLATPDARRSWARELRAQIATPISTGTHAPSTVTDTPPADNGPTPLSGEIAHRELDLLWLLQLTHDAYVEEFRGTAIKRAKVWMLRRNAAIALGNVGGTDCVEPLTSAMVGDEHPLVRGHAAWALGQIAVRHPAAGISARLSHALEIEQDGEVRLEIRLALEESEQAGPRD